MRDTFIPELKSQLKIVWMIFVFILTGLIKTKFPEIINTNFIFMIVVYNQQSSLRVHALFFLNPTENYTT